MKLRGWIVIIVIALILLFNAFYIIDERQQVIITQFGEPIGDAIVNAGLHIKTPFIQQVHYFEKRILEWDGDPKQIPTSDKRYLWLDTFSRWRISDPLKFFETTRNENFAHGRLDDIISGTTRDIVSSNKLLDLVRNSNREMLFTEEYMASTMETAADNEIKNGREKISTAIFNASKELIAEYGIDLIDVKIKRINYVEEVRSKVYDRMISERQKIAALYRSEGQGRSAEILGKMKKELDQIESEAYKRAEEIKGQADAEAINVYANAYNRDPNFYQFWKTLETYEKTIDEKNVMIMSTDSEYYKYIKSIE